MIPMGRLRLEESTYHRVVGPVGGTREPRPRQTPKRPECRPRHTAPPSGSARFASPMSPVCHPIVHRWRSSQNREQQIHCQEQESASTPALRMLEEPKNVPVFLEGEAGHWSSLGATECFFRGSVAGQEI